MLLFLHSRRDRDEPVLLEGDEEGAGSPGEWSQMSFGNQHSVGVTRTGEVFTWGRAEDYGSLGHGSDDTIMKPKQVKSLLGKAVTQVSCSYHTAVVTREGELFTW